MPRVKAPVPPVLAQRAAVLRARRELDEVDEMRFVVEAVTQGLSQDDIAEIVGASQATISRIVKRVAQDPKVLRPSVKEIVNRATVREISRSKMVQELRTLKISYVKKPDSEWMNLRAALRRGLVLKAEAEVVAEDAARKIVDRVTHSMSLEAQHVPQLAVNEMVREATAKLVADLG